MFVAVGTIYLGGPLMDNCCKFLAAGCSLDPSSNSTILCDVGKVTVNAASYTAEVPLTATQAVEAQITANATGTAIQAAAAQTTVTISVSMLVLGLPRSGPYFQPISLCHCLEAKQQTTPLAPAKCYDYPKQNQASHSPGFYRMHRTSAPILQLQQVTYHSACRAGMMLTPS